MKTNETTMNMYLINAFIPGFSLSDNCIVMASTPKEAIKKLEDEMMGVKINKVSIIHPDSIFKFGGGIYSSSLNKYAPYCSTELKEKEWK